MEIQKILVAMELIEIKDNPQNIAWIGPDCLNSLGITNFTIEQSPWVKGTLNDSFKTFMSNYPYELHLRESSYFHKMYSNLI